MAGAIHNTRSTLLDAKVGRVSKMPPNITWAFWSKTFRVSHWVIPWMKTDCEHWIEKKTETRMRSDPLPGSGLFFLFFSIIRFFIKLMFYVCFFFLGFFIGFFRNLFFLFICKSKIQIILYKKLLLYLFMIMKERNEWFFKFIYILLTPLFVNVFSSI
jgi:hypothetical protein